MTEFLMPQPPPTASRLPEGDPRDEASLALFGHDLRAALSDVVGGLRLIDCDTLDPLNRVQINRVRASAEALAQLLEHGLTVMLGEAAPVQPHHLNLQRFLTELDLRWSGRALEKGIAFSVRKGPDLPARVPLDRVALDRVLSNLLGNAFKYCERGSVVCEVDTAADGGLRVTVRDNGSGFPASVLDHSLPLHNRPQGMTEAGSGMGLHIAADLTHRLGGRLTLRNLVPSGAEARVYLPPPAPLAGHGSGRAEASDRRQPEPAQGQMILDGRRVLIADDNPTSQSLAIRLATGLGAEVAVVGDGVEAIGRLEREAFDLLIVDVEMPRLSGLDVIRCLRRLPGDAARMPVIAVTAFGLPSNRKAILAAGANDLMSKPLLCPRAFANVVSGLLMPRPGPAAAQGALPAAPLPPKPPAMDRSHLDRLLEMAGPETGRDLLDRLIGDLDCVQRGLESASPIPDWDAIRSHSHVLISLAGAVGGSQLQAEAEALNLIGHRMDRAALDGLLPDVRTHLDAMIEVIGQVRHAYHLGETR